MSGKEESMPRKSKHGTDVARWGHHKEMKEDRKKNRNKSKQKWKQQIQIEEASNKIMMTKEQMQTWVGKNCKFALNEKAEKISIIVVNRIAKASKEITGEQFINIVAAILNSKLASVPIPAAMQTRIKDMLQKKIIGKEKYNAQQMKILMRNILLGTEQIPGLVRQFNYDINSPVITNIIDEIIGQIHERKGPSDRPQGNYPERKSQEGQEAQKYIGEGGPKIHFTPTPKR